MSNEPVDIVLLDDDPDICTMAETVLQLSGMTVRATSTPGRLDELLKEAAPRVLLMDMLLGNADGRNICRRLRSGTSTAGLYIIMMSGHSDARASCLEAGADDFIEKPFDLDVLTAKLKKGLGAKSAAESDQVSSS